MKRNKESLRIATFRRVLRQRNLLWNSHQITGKDSEVSMIHRYLERNYVLNILGGRYYCNRGYDMSLERKKIFFQLLDKEARDEACTATHPVNGTCHDRSR